MADKKVMVNRAPVLTLWAIVVAEHLGYDEDAAMTLGKAVAGLNAQSKGRSLGIFEVSPAKPEDKPTAVRLAGKPVLVPLLGRQVTAVDAGHGLRAIDKGKPVDPDSVRRYLKSKFGENLLDVLNAMEALASAFEPSKLADEAYALYEQFRPVIPAGKKGWGAAGELDIEKIHALARKKV
jgi:hypothetical protein